MSDDLEERLRDALRRRGEPDPLVLRRLSGELAALPPRRPYRRRGLAAAAVVVLALAALAAPRLGQVASDLGPSASPGAISSPQPSPAWSPGCGPSSLGISYEAYASPGTQFGWPSDTPVSEVGTVVDDFRDLEVSGYEPILPSDPGSRRLRLIFVQPQVNNVVLVYSRLPIAANDTEADLLAMGALVLNQRPFSGQDGDFVLGIVPYDDWRVEVGPYSAALVLGSPTAAGIRPFGLYWADGDREWILHGGGPARPEDLVDLARSIYC